MTGIKRTQQCIRVEIQLSWTGNILSDNIPYAHAQSFLMDILIIYLFLKCSSKESTRVHDNNAQTPMAILFMQNE